MSNQVTVNGGTRAKLLLGLASAVTFAGAAMAASYEWTFDGGNLSTSLGNGSMTYRDAQTASLSAFGTTGGGVPNIGGQAANFLHVPVMPNIGNGYHLTLNDTGPNGGGSYVNNYTVIFDLLSPGNINWTSLLNTDPLNASGNDGDFYIASDGSVGIGSGGYSAAGIFAADTWYRLAFVDNGTTLSYYLNGTFVGQRTTGVSIDGRWSLYSNLDLGADLLLFNEGDTSGNYTHELYLNSIAFVDHAMTGGELAALGGPSAQGILVPEPTVMSLFGMGLLAVGLRCSRKNGSRR